MKPFNITNWYWSVQDSSPTTQVYSSASGAFVPLTDATYTAWLADGTLPTNIDTAANLGAVLAPYLQRPTDANVLNGYTTALAMDAIEHVLFKVAFNHENRIRAIERALSLNGSPANLTVAQALAAVKALM